MDLLSELKLSRKGYLLEVERAKNEIIRQTDLASRGVQNMLEFTYQNLAKAELALLDVDKEIHYIELKRQTELEERDKERFELEKRNTEASIRASDSVISTNKNVVETNNILKKIQIIVAVVSALTLVVLIVQCIYLALQYDLDGQKNKETVSKSKLELPQQKQKVNKPLLYPKNHNLKESDTLKKK